jgi:hypothetical protein
MTRGVMSFRRQIKETLMLTDSQIGGVLCRIGEDPDGFVVMLNKDHPLTTDRQARQVLVAAALANLFRHSPRLIRQTFGPALAKEILLIPCGNREGLMLRLLLDRGVA